MLTFVNCKLEQDSTRMGQKSFDKQPSHAYCFLQDFMLKASSLYKTVLNSHVYIIHTDFFLSWQRRESGCLFESQPHTQLMSLQVDSLLVQEQTVALVTGPPPCDHCDFLSTRQVNLHYALHEYHSNRLKRGIFLVLHKLITNGRAEKEFVRSVKPNSATSEVLRP